MNQKLSTKKLLLSAFILVILVVVVIITLFRKGNKSDYIENDTSNIKYTLAGGSAYMDGDYYLNNGTMKITRDAGRTWSDVDITAKEIEETVALSADQMSISPESIFISPDESLPSAFIYGENPKIKLQMPGETEWKTVAIPDYDTTTGTEGTKPFIYRSIGFVTDQVGYCALGTDWSMGSGEVKIFYFTTDGGKTWVKSESDFPLQNSSQTLMDVNMVNETTAFVSVLKRGTNQFPDLYMTSDRGVTWTKCEVSYEELSPTIAYLGDLVEAKEENGTYFLSMGQENDGGYVAVFASEDGGKNWYLARTDEKSIHTVG